MSRKAKPPHAAGEGTHLLVRTVRQRPFRRAGFEFGPSGRVLEIAALPAGALDAILAESYLEARTITAAEADGHQVAKATEVDLATLSRDLASARRRVSELEDELKVIKSGRARPMPGMTPPDDDGGNPLY